MPYRLFPELATQVAIESVARSPKRVCLDPMPRALLLGLPVYVELDGDEIVVTRPGTEMMTAYRKTSDRPNLVLKDGSPSGTSVAGLLGPVPAS